MKQQVVTFGVVIVKPPVLLNKRRADSLIKSLQTQVFGCPVILMAQDANGVTKYYGQTKLVSFMKTVPLQSVPWKQYTLP